MKSKWKIFLTPSPDTAFVQSRHLILYVGGNQNERGNQQKMFENHKIQIYDEKVFVDVKFQYYHRK